MTTKAAPTANDTPVNPGQKGFKKTKLGWIPEEWEIGYLKDFVVSLTAGVSVNSEDFEPSSNRLGVLKTSALHAGKFLPQNSKTVIQKDEDRVKEYVEEGAVMISRMNTPNLVGENAIAQKTHHNLFLPDRIWKTKYKNNVTFDKLWLGHLFQTKFLKGRFGKIATGTSGSMKNISKRDVLNSNIPIPPLPEQRAIARILSTWDRAIDRLQKLIAKKQERKKGLMQQLLSGKKRFAGFEGEWEQLRIDEIFEFLSTTSFSRNDLEYSNDPDRVKYIHYGDIHATYQQIVLNLEVNTEVPVLKKRAKLSDKTDFLRDGDLIVADASEDYEGVADCIELKNVGQQKIIAGLHTFALRDKKGLTEHGVRGYLLKSEKVVKRLREVATGSKVYGV